MLFVNKSIAKKTPEAITEQLWITYTLVDTN